MYTKRLSATAGTSQTASCGSDDDSLVSTSSLRSLRSLGLSTFGSTGLSANASTASVGNVSLGAVLPSLPQRESSIRHRSTTNFIGLRCLHLSELVRLNTGGAFILVVPHLQNVWKVHADRRGDLIVKQRRTNVHDRIVATVLKNHVSEFWDTSKPQRWKRVRQHLLKHHGISLTNGMCLELPCVVRSYPHRFDYVSRSLASADVRRHVKEGGIQVELLDFTGPLTLLLKWKEMTCLQVFVEHYRVPKCRNQEAYCSLFLNNYDTVHDDTVAMLELALAYEKCKLKKLQKNTSKP